MGFFDQPQTNYVPGPEPPGFDLLRDMLMRKTFALQNDPYQGAQARPNSLTPAPAFAGSGGGPDSSFFYGNQGQDGGGGQDPGAPQVPRMHPILARLMQMARTTRTLPSRPTGENQSPSGLGSFFARLAAARQGGENRAITSTRGPMPAAPQDMQPPPTDQRPPIRSGGGGGGPVRRIVGGLKFDGEPAYDSRYSMQQGREMGLGDLNSILSQYGITGSYGEGGRPLYSGGGGSYQYSGAHHEGAGPGGQTDFLERMLGEGSGAAGSSQHAARLGQNPMKAQLDQLMAGFGQKQNMLQSRGLAPGSSYQDLANWGNQAPNTQNIGGNVPQKHSPGYWAAQSNGPQPSNPLPPGPAIQPQMLPTQTAQADTSPALSNNSPQPSLQPQPPKLQGQ